MKYDLKTFLKRCTNTIDDINYVHTSGNEDKYFMDNKDNNFDYGTYVITKTNKTLILTMIGNMDCKYEDYKTIKYDIDGTNKLYFNNEAIEVIF